MINMLICKGKRNCLAVMVMFAISMCCLAISTLSAMAANLPPGFSETVIPGPTSGGWNEAAGMTFESNGRMYVWERSGRVWLQDPSDTAPSLLIDIGEEVGAWLDHGFLGFALDPNFRQNGYIYL